MAHRRKLLLTVPLKGDFSFFIDDEVVEGIRLNTTIQVEDKLTDLLETAKERAHGKEVWIDLKGRQLRIASQNVEIQKDQEIHYIGLSHEIELNLKDNQVYAIFDNGKICAEVKELKDNRTLVIPSSTEKRKGLPLPAQGEVGLRQGMSVTILDDSLKVKGFLTERDKKWIEAGAKVGIHNYMLSFTERRQDIFDVLALDKEAKLKLKIESREGMRFVENAYSEFSGLTSKYRGKVNLMAALGDLYLQLEPDEIILACKKIIKADPNAVMASRLLESSMQYNKRPKSQDLFDLTCKMYLGYKKFMLGDDVCRSKEGCLEAIDLFKTMSENYGRVRNWRELLS